MVSLSKNQTVSLSKQSTALSQLQFGLGWDPVKKKGLFGSIFGGNDSIDLDAGCVLLDAAGNKIDTIWFRKLKSSCGSVVHSGDNLTGEGDGDDEIIHVNLLKLPANVEYLAFTVNSFRGQSFNDVDNAFCRVVEQGGCSAGIYLNRQQGYYQYDLSRLADWSLWVADYNDYPDFYYAFDMWQYSDSAVLDGVPTQADLNFLFVPSPRG